MPKSPDHQYKSVDCGSCGHSIRVPVYCHDRFCQLCSRSRAWKIRDRMTNLLKASPLEPGHGFKFLTLTIKSQPDLKPMCKIMLKSFKKLRNRKFWKRVFVGGCFILEITGQEGKWHAHLHIIVQGPYCPQHLILKHWRQINGTGGVFIKQCNTRGVLYYLTKYLTKEADYQDDCETISNTLKDFRLFQPFGSWHALLPKYKKKTMPCPSCGGTIWIPAHIIDQMMRDTEKPNHPSQRKKIDRDSMIEMRRWRSKL